MLTEEIIRLANDFPTTAREKAKHDKDINAKDSALREMAESMLANVGDKLSPEEKVRRLPQNLSTELGIFHKI